eukprot:Nitzschia sp. Nitz4//scaffold213_size37731//16759//17482//NITZ4_007720-RA/size37731-augustus-gene-0.52-mRNA-1//-1//CDS//3329542065//229//frame0
MDVSDIARLPAAQSSLLAPTDQSLRVACYCEENVWRLTYRHLSKDTRDDPHTHYYVAFVTNPNQCVPMFQQVASSDPDHPCYWDYHVILFQKTLTGTIVLDMDSRLPYACSLKEYVEGTFPSCDQWRSRFLPYFRVVPAQEYLKNFSSDRRHMYNQETKEWSATPPDYACITNHNHRQHNLSQYLDLKAADDWLGHVLSLEELQRYFG